jgi:F420-dependent oxidoreductase-like protein
VEGWHGQEWGKPLAKTREYVEIVRSVLARERLEHHGAHYDIPVRGGTGLGKPLKLMMRPLRADIPIYLAAIAPKAVEQALEIADGWLPIFWSPEQARNVFPLERAREGFDIAPSVPAVVTDDVGSGRDALKQYYSFYVGGMGARGKNFYNTVATQYGWGDEARAVQDLYLDGKKAEAAAALPEALIDGLHLVGPRGYVADRIAAYRDAGVTSLFVEPVEGTDPVRMIAAMRELIDA